MRNIAVIVALVALFCPGLQASARVDDVTLRALEELDAVIAEKNRYHLQRERRIAELKERLRRSSDVRAKYELCSSLFEEYLHYQADSSLYYINRKLELLPRLSRPGLADEIAINRAEVMGVAGMYNEALAELRKVNPDRLEKRLQEYYYFTFRACYGWIADYTAAVSEKQKYLKKTSLYRDSILLLASPGVERDIVLAEKELLSGKSGEAVVILRKHIGTVQDMRQQSYLNYTMSEAYEMENDTDKQIYYLAQTAIWDMKRAVREYAALQRLARLVYERGDLDKAYFYLNCSMEDAVASSARLRFLEVTEFYPIIDKAYKAKAAQERAITRRMLVCVSVLAFLLVVVSVYLYYWMKKLSLMRKHLYGVNRKLIAANQSLAQTGKIKEVYIARYLDRCVGYLEKLEQYRRSLEKLAMASKIEELFKTIRSEQFLRDERKNFYNEFDKSFLDLFPNFIADFNRLLVDDGKIYPKSNEILNTELRIFALIRLGVTDASRIAHFLGYSLATVYNYRSKVRNRAIGDKECFEQTVMNL